MQKKDAKQEDAKVDDRLASQGKAALEGFDTKSTQEFRPTKKESRLISLRISTEMMSGLKVVAGLKQVTGYQTLIKTYISEGLRRDWVAPDATRKTYVEMKGNTAAASVAVDFWQPTQGGFRVEESVGGPYGNVRRSED